MLIDVILHFLIPIFFGLAVFLLVSIFGIVVIRFLLPRMALSLPPIALIPLSFVFGVLIFFLSGLIGFLFGLEMNQVLIILAVKYIIAILLIVIYWRDFKVFFFEWAQKVIKSPYFCFMLLVSALAGIWALSSQPITGSYSADLYFYLTKSNYLGQFGFYNLNPYYTLELSQSLYSNNLPITFFAIIASIFQLSVHFVYAATTWLLVLLSMITIGSIFEILFKDTGRKLGVIGLLVFIVFLFLVPLNENFSYASSFLGSLATPPWFFAFLYGPICFLLLLFILTKAHLKTKELILPALVFGLSFFIHPSLFIYTFCFVFVGIIYFLSLKKSDIAKRLFVILLGMILIGGGMALIMTQGVANEGLVQSYSDPNSKISTFFGQRYYQLNETFKIFKVKEIFNPKIWSISAIIAGYWLIFRRKKYISLLSIPAILIPLLIFNPLLIYFTDNILKYPGALFRVNATWGFLYLIIILVFTGLSFIVWLGRHLKPGRYKKIFEISLILLLFIPFYFMARPLPQDVKTLIFRPYDYVIKRPFGNKSLTWLEKHYNQYYYMIFRPEFIDFINNLPEKRPEILAHPTLSLGLPAQTKATVFAAPKNLAHLGHPLGREPIENADKIFSPKVKDISDDLLNDIFIKYQVKYLLWNKDSSLALKTKMEEWENADKSKLLYSDQELSFWQLLRDNSKK